MVLVSQQEGKAPESTREFQRQFQELSEKSPIRAIKLFLLYLDSRGMDTTSRVMAPLATNGTLILSVLENWEAASALRLLPLLCQLDGQFLYKFARRLSELKDQDSILRWLALAPGLRDYSILIPYLRSLSTHSDSRVRSRVAKLLCQIRPNKGLIERYAHSYDARVRASVMEALWDPKVIHGGAEVLAVLRAAMDDPHHRVVANALVGLYRLGETEVLEKMLALSASKEHLFRAATAWAMGAVEDPRAIPTLRYLTGDRSFTVRRRASSSLSSLGDTPPIAFL